jgi:hypothetical protein
MMVLQNSMSLLKGELGSSNNTCVTSTLVGNEVTGMEAERVCNIKEEEVDELARIPVIKMEPKVSGMSVVSVTYISYGLYAELPTPIFVCTCETKI